MDQFSEVLLGNIGSWTCCLAIQQDVGDGWWEGQTASGEVGLFPEAYAEVRSSMCYNG